MATTSNTYTGNGSNKLFSITFPYLETTDVDVYLNGTLQTITTQYTFANATTIEFVAAPANGAVVLLDRSTDDTALQATFFPGSSIKAADLNLDFDQVLYIAQETANEATTATTTAATATTTANTALSQSAAAVSTANTSLSQSTAAVSTANTASTNASNAVTTANTALSTANSASATANSALNAVSSSFFYVAVADVANIPTTGLFDNQGIQVLNSTGIESFTPLSGIPGGFVGNSALFVRIRYSTATSSWVWVDYNANDPETRYLGKAGGTMTGTLTFAGGQPTATTSAANIVQLTDSTSSTSTITAATPNSVKSAYDLANAALPKAGGAMTGDLTLNAQSDVRFADADSSNWVAFQAPSTVASNVTWTLPSADATVSGFALVSDASGTLSWAAAGGGATGGSTDKVFFENDQTVTTSYTLTANKNAMTAGPVTVANGAIVTVPSNASWIVL